MPLARALPGPPRTTPRRDMPKVGGHGPCHLAAEPDASRGDSLALAGLLTRTGHAAVRAILALAFREALSERRQAIAPPQPGT